MSIHYFITYQWRMDYDDWKYENIVIDIHPINWIIERIKAPQQYVLLFFEQITPYFYNKYKDEFG